ncbi:ImmA/IrrE family metallo-endopeptidase [Frigoribacterium salinisoli]
MADVPINPEVLRWAVEEARITDEDAAAACGVDWAIYESWISGEAKPNTGQVRQLARRLGRSFQFFMLPAPPESAPVSARFRKSLHEEVPEPEKESAAIRTAKRVQDVAYWALDDARVSAGIPRRLAQETPASYAKRLRQSLGWNLQIQRQMTSKSAVFRGLRERIENLGVVVLLQGAGQKSFRGFSLSGEVPLIFVNRDYKGAALRSFTLIHEMAHLGSGTGGRSCYYDDTKAERWCNQVATEFLMPAQEFKAYLDKRNFTYVTETNLEPVRLASNYFHASWLAIAIRLQEIGRAGSTLPDYVRKNAILEQDPPAPVPGIDRSTPVLRQEEFGSGYVRALRDAVVDDRLSELEAGRLLRSNAKQLGSLWQLTSGVR